MYCLLDVRFKFSKQFCLMSWIIIRYWEEWDHGSQTKQKVLIKIHNKKNWWMYKLFKASQKQFQCESNKMSINNRIPTLCCPWVWQWTFFHLCFWFANLFSLFINGFNAFILLSCAIYHHTKAIHLVKDEVGYNQLIVSGEWPSCRMNF